MTYLLLGRSITKRTLVRRIEVSIYENLTETHNSDIRTIEILDGITSLTGINNEDFMATLHPYTALDTNIAEISTIISRRLLGHYDES